MTSFRSSSTTALRCPPNEAYDCALKHRRRAAGPMKLRSYSLEQQRHTRIAQDRRHVGEERRALLAVGEAVIKRERECG